MPNPQNFVKFGVCPRCGRSGIDDDTGERLTGYELVEYRGEFMCNLCVNQLQDEEYDNLARQKDVEERQFLGAISMRSTPEE